MLRFFTGLLILSSVFYLPYFSNSALAQDTVGSTTQEVIENMSSLDKPEAIPLVEPNCGFLGLGCLFEPKVDYTHEDLLPKEKHITNVSLWDKLKAFFGLYEKSAAPETGYSYTYFPNEVDPAALGQGSTDYDTTTEIVHEKVKQSLLPYQVNVENSKTIANNTTGSQPNTQTNVVPTAAGGVGPFQGLVYYSQSNSQWAGEKGVKYCDTAQTKIETIGNSGCGPTSVAMIVAGKNSAINPKTVWNEYVQAAKTYCGTYLSDHQSFLTNNYQFKSPGSSTCSSNNQCVSLMAQYLNAVPEGSRALLLYAHFRKNPAGDCHWGGHYLVVAAVKGSVPYVYDPYYGDSSAPTSVDSLNYECKQYNQFLIIDL